MAFFDLTGKNVVITGGGKGIGESIAQVFYKQGASIFLLDRDYEAAAQAAKNLSSEGIRVTAVACDVSNYQEVSLAFGKILSHNNHVDILVNSAGIAHIGSLETTSEEALDRLYNVNVKGVYNCMRCAVETMKNQQGGVILNICSIAATSGIENRFAYSMTKGAVLSMSRSVARDYIKDNIRVDCISPARIHTSFVDGFIAENYKGQEEAMFEKLSQAQPIGRMGRPSEVATLALYLASDEASFATGCDYYLDGGFTYLK